MFRSPRVVLALVVVALTIALAVPVQAKHGGVSRFATLPEGPGHPEGIAADASGNIYVATFEFPPSPNRIYVYGENGRLRVTRNITYSPLGMLVTGGSLWVADFGNGDVRRYPLPLTPTSAEAAPIAVCPAGTAPAETNEPSCVLNALAVDGSGNTYVSDSFGGRIFRITAGTSSPWFTHEMLQPGGHAFPGFGANGLAFNTSFTALFIANTGDDRIFRLAVAGGAPGALTTFAESVNGADGIAFDQEGRLWVAENQNDRLVALNANGRIVARRGSFEGISNGAPKGLLFPASIVLVGGFIYVTNAALALTPAVGDEPEEDVTRFTVSRVTWHGADEEHD